MEIGNGNKLSDILGVDKFTLLFKSDVQKRYIVFYLKLSMERAEPENLNFVYYSNLILVSSLPPGKTSTLAVKWEIPHFQSP